MGIQTCRYSADRLNTRRTGDYSKSAALKGAFIGVGLQIGSTHAFKEWLVKTYNGNKAGFPMFVCEITSYTSLPKEEDRAEHLRFLGEKGASGKVVMAGRFADSKGALIVWRVDSLNEAKNLAQQDPYIKKGLVKYELREWTLSFDYTVNPPLKPN